MSQDEVGLSPKGDRRYYSKEEKQKAVELTEKIGTSAAAKELGIGGGNLSRWRSQFKESGAAGLVNKSSRPHHQPKRTSQWVIDKIKLLKKEKPEMGVSAVSNHLARHEAIVLSSNTVAKIFKKEGIQDGDSGHAEQSHFVKGDKHKRLEHTVEKEIGEWERFARENPNDLWQMDIMCFYIRGAHRVSLITAIDDCSRMIVGWGLYRQQTADNVLEVLKAALSRYGAPKEVLTDQGAQFKHWGGVTQFEKLLLKLNVAHIKARPHHPQTCGKIEAYHKTIQRELIDKEFFHSQEQACERISRFVDHYNFARPHTSLEGFTPSDRFFGVINAVKKYLEDFKKPKNEQEEKDETIGLGRGSKLYLIGKVLGQDVRIQELAGQLAIHVNQHPWREINLLQ